MATSSITANFTISDPKAAQDFATAFIRNSRKATTPVVMSSRMITSADAARTAGTCSFALRRIDVCRHRTIDIKRLQLKDKLIVLCGFVLALFGSFAQTATANGKTWTYSVNYTTGEAEIGSNADLFGSLKIPSSLGGYPVTSIGDNAFRGCTGVTSIVIPKSIQKIGQCAFYNCSNLISINIPTNIIDIGSFAFTGCTSLGEGMVVKDGYLVTINGSIPGAVEIPDGVRYIVGGVFSYSPLASITFPESVTGIGPAAFAGCSSLTAIELPSKLEVLGPSVFSDCVSLISITIPSTVKSIGSGAFNQCTRLANVAIQDGVDGIDSYAFSGCSSLVELTIPSSVTHIGQDAFRGCTGLGNGLIVVDRYALVLNGECPSEVVIPEGTRLIADGLFYGQEGMLSIVFPATLSEIGNLSFVGCTGLTSLTIPTNVMSIGFGAFQGCSKLATAKLESAATNIPSACFRNCSVLDKIEIPPTVAAIDQMAFQGCEGLTAVNFPAGLKDLGRWAFEGCVSLSNCVFNGDAPKVFADTFDGVPATCVAYVAKNSSGWGVAIPGTWCGMRIEYRVDPLPEHPVIKPVSGTIFDTSLTVSMTCTSESATIYYTTNGTMPTIESPTYTTKFRIYDKTTVRAIVVDENGTPSEMVVAEYATGTCESPVIAPADGTMFHSEGQRVSITWPGSNGVLRVTMDGSDPTKESPVYEGPFTIADTTTIKTKVFSDTLFDSGVATATLTRVWVKVATPEIVAAGMFTGCKNKVAISCATEGAAIYYTLDGSEPTTASARYERPFCVTESCTVNAMALKNDHLGSDVATRNIMREWSIGATMGKSDHEFTTSGHLDFVRTNDLTAALGESMRSGAIKNCQTSILSTVVVGPGTLSFKWKTSCEEDVLHEWDHAEFVVDGKVVEVLDGITEWDTVTHKIVGEGEHVIIWRYVKDAEEGAGEDCLWVSEYIWASDYAETQTTSNPVPYSWLAQKCCETVDEYNSYESVAKQLALNGRLTVEQCYVAGVDPESYTNDFKTVIEMLDGVPHVTWNPDLKDERTYKIFGSANLVSGGNWEFPTNSSHRFFKVSVEMP